MYDVVGGFFFFGVDLSTDGKNKWTENCKRRRRRTFEAKIIEGKSANIFTHCQELFRSSFIVRIYTSIPFKTVNFYKSTHAMENGNQMSVKDIKWASMLNQIKRILCSCADCTICGIRLWLWIIMSFIVKTVDIVIVLVWCRQQELLTRYTFASFCISYTIFVGNSTLVALYSISVTFSLLWCALNVVIHNTQYSMEIKNWSIHSF